MRQFSGNVVVEIEDGCDAGDIKTLNGDKRKSTA
jgi:hypothetical protein